MEEKIRRILDETSGALGNPVAFFDTSYRLLAHTDNPVEDDPIWNELIRLGTFSHETVDFFNRAGFIKAYAESETIALMRSDELAYDRINGKIFDENGVQIANISIVACQKPFEAKDYEIIEAACERIAEANRAGGDDRITEQFFSETWLIELLDGGRPDALPDAMTRISAGLRVAVVDVSQYERTVTHLAYFRDTFSKLRSDFYYFVYLNSVVIIMSGADQTAAELELGALREFFAQYDIYAGVSQPFHNILELRKYYKQAIQALNRGADGNAGGNIFTYKSRGTKSDNQAGVAEKPDGV
ncbi:MAG: hypothetical protein LBK41_02175 [Clostridiales bacterium]|nr:hypothetical protein [Clostridiales bacterium]